MNYWDEFKNKVIGKYPHYEKNLQSVTQNPILAEIEKKVGITLPVEYVNLYQSCNGEDQESVGFVFALIIMRLEDVIDEINSCMKEDCSESKEESRFCTSTPATHIKSQQKNSKWLPFLSDGCGNYIGLDFDPDTRGVQGQIINFGIEEENKYVFASSLNEFFKLTIEMFESDLVVEEDGIYSYDFYNFIDALKRAA